MRFTHCNKTVKRIKDKCTEWRKSVFLDAQTNDTVSSWFNDMEYDSVCGIPENISMLKAFSGASSCIVNEKKQYSITFKKKISDLAVLNSVKVSLRALTGGKSSAALVVSIDKGNSSLFRDIHYFSGDIVEENKWFDVLQSVRIPEINDDEAVLKVYVWNPSDTDAFVDDINIMIR